MAQFIERVKQEHNLKKLAYTARLDPMACGKVIVLYDNYCKYIREFNNKNKIYQVDVIFGISTDSDDALGIIKNINQEIIDNDINISDDIFTFNNYKFMQKYHYYSTKMLNHRRNNNFNEYSHQVEIIKSFVVGNITRFSYLEWRDKIIKDILLIDPNKNFRQSAIIEQWKNLKLKSLQFIKLELHVSCGFFVRQFVQDISNSTGIPMMCHNIHRVDYLD